MIKWVVVNVTLMPRVLSFFPPLATPAGWRASAEIAVDERAQRIEGLDTLVEHAREALKDMGHIGPDVEPDSTVALRHPSSQTHGIAEKNLV
jgi:hypothetical protein